MQASSPCTPIAGTSMRSKPVALLLSDLGITKTHSRPRVSDDNPFSESQFRTVKYHPDFPARFDSELHARQFCQTFFPWYNQEHCHSGIGYMPPAAVHFGQAPPTLRPPVNRFWSKLSMRIHCASRVAAHSRLPCPRRSVSTCQTRPVAATGSAKIRH